MEGGAVDGPGAEAQVLPLRLEGQLCGYRLDREDLGWMSLYVNVLCPHSGSILP
jgi:hypothetical protein